MSTSLINVEIAFGINETSLRHRKILSVRNYKCVRSNCIEIRFKMLSSLGEVCKVSGLFRGLGLNHTGHVL